LPHDTIETMRETINFARHLSEEYEMKMQVTLNTPFPGTPQYENAEKMGLTIHTRDWNMYNLRHPIISTKNFTRRDLYELHFEAVEQAVLKRSVGYD
jgi:anaerobic magnesium-protoporphyrin IX monomethyl ester cyclase